MKYNEDILLRRVFYTRKPTTFYCWQIITGCSMLKLPFIYQFKQLKPAIIANKELAEIGKLKRYQSQIETLLNFGAKTVEMRCAIIDETKIRLLNSYNFLTHCESEPLDDHRGSGRIQSCSRAVDVFFSVVKNEIMPRWIIAEPL